MAKVEFEQALIDANVERQYKEASMHLLMTRAARIVIMGATGTGKTSVLNAAFKKTRGRVGHGPPCTQEVSEFAPTETCPVWIYDTKGFEPLSDNQDIFDGLRSLKEARMAAAKQHHPQSPEYHAERLHAVWWVTDDRFEPDCAQRVHETFGEEIPFFVIINKCDKDPEEVDSIVTQVGAHCPWATRCIPLVATPKNGPLKKQCPACCESDIIVNAKKGWFMCCNDSCQKEGEKQIMQEQYGIDDLLSSTVEHLPALVAHSFFTAQRDYLQDLDTTAYRLILVATGAAVTIGAIPILVSDGPLLLANQMALFRSLAAVYGITPDPASAKQVLAAMSHLGAGAMTGQALGSGLKAIPGVGSILGGFTCATVAGVTTLAIGKTLQVWLRRVRRLAVFGEVTSEHFFKAMHVDEVQEVFKRNLQWARSHRLSSAPMGQLMDS